MVSPDLNHWHQRYTASIILQTSLVRWVTKRNNYWDDCIQEMNVWHKNISDILLLPSQLYLESECNGLSSDLQYGISRSHLNHRRQKVMVNLQTYGTSRPHLNYWRQLLRWLHLRDRCGTKRIRHSLSFPRDRTSSQNAMILVRTYVISRSLLNHRCQLLRQLHSRDGCGNITYQTFSFFPSSMFEESECDGLSSDLRYLQITFGPPNVNVTRHR